MKYKAIIFDVDGVLIKSKYLFTERLEKEHGITHESVQGFFTGVFRKCTIGEADLKEELVKVMKGWGWNGTLDELLEFWFTKGSELDEEMLRYVETLQKSGVKCFVATDQEKYRGEYFRQFFSNHNLFESVFTSGEIGHLKKTGPFWDAVLDSLGEQFTKEDLLFVDDDEHKVEAVQKLGIDTHLFIDLVELKKYLEE